GQVSGVFLRGSNSNHVLLLVDGVRVNSATTGSNAFENLPINQIDRIEILRGPASSLYGADAIGGVIQIFTKRGDGPPQFSASAGAGTYRTERYNAGVSGESGATRYNLQAGYHDTDSFSATNERAGFLFNPDRDRYRNKNANFAVTQRLADGHELTIGSWLSEGNTHFDAGLGSDDVNHQRLSGSRLESRNRLATGWQSLLQVARGTDKSVISGSFAGLFRTDQDQFMWQNDIDAPGGKATAGLEYRREEITSDTAYTGTHRTVLSPFAGYAGEFNRHLLQTSIRRDDNSQFGTHNSGNLAYGYRITPAWRLALGIGSAFKAPSFNDLYFPSSFGFSGNPNLKPERALNGEAALYYDQDGTRIGLTLFANRIRDLIAIDPAFTTLINVDEATIRGATLSYSATVNAYRIRAEATHQNAKDAATGNLLPRRARNFGSASLFKDWQNWQLGGELVASSMRFDRATNSPSTRLAGYGLLNLVAQYRLSPRLSVRARWNNIFNKRYELAQGFNTPGSNIFIAMEYLSP
ncbi:MAG: TonB-dependent receptor, partial [Burkholderiales bacterium]|nr:TonB-dependent receptor [Burkholderiales bacterium]